MKSLISILLVLVISLLSIAVLKAQSNGAPDSLSYQGILVMQPLANNELNVTFTLYDAATAGTVVWTETQSVTTTDGLYNTVLGRVSTLSDVPFDQPLWLGVQVGGDPEMVPRTPLTSVPYALSLRNLRVEPETATEGPKLIGGYSGNAAGVSAVGAIVSGGGKPTAPNQANAPYSSVGGGQANTASGNDATVGGGTGNTASGASATIAGGENNTAIATKATIGGGGDNAASANSATVSGGTSNSATAGGATVIGGQENMATGSFGTILGGRYNEASGDFGFALGYNAKAMHSGSFIFSDTSELDLNDAFETTGAHQFLIRAVGGVGIGTNTPQNNARLHVAHPSAGTNDWGLVLSNTSVANNRTGMRLSNAGTFEITSNADNNGPSFARLSSAGTWTAVSDRRRKTDIEPATNLLASALAMKPVRYRFKNKPDAAEKHLGLIAQDVQTVEPSLVTKGDVLTLDYAGLGVVALGAIQAQQAMIDAQQRRNAQIEARVAELERLIQQLAVGRD